MNSRKLLIVSLIILMAVGGIYLVLHKPQATNTTSSTTASATVVAVGKSAPDFSVQTIDGQQFSLAAHKGKPVIIFAMFGGCGECIPVGQTLSQLQKDYAAQGLTVIALDILKGEPLSVLEQYRNDAKTNFPLVSYNAAVVNAYKLTAPEITYVIDKNGNIAYINQNALSYEQYKQQLDKIL